MMKFEDEYLVVVGDNEIVADISYGVDGRPVVVGLDKSGEVVFEDVANALSQRVLVECVVAYCAHRYANRTRRHTHRRAY